MGIVVQTDTFDPGAMLNSLHAAQLGVGAVVAFVGYVRDFNDGEEVAGMLLEHYPGMTEKALQLIVDEARARWSLLNVEVLHRVGRLEPGEPIVFVGVSSAHRAAAFEASHFIIDYLKTRAPFWKKEDTGSGPRWVDARDQDAVEMDKWQRRSQPGEE
ncbi:molybdopterin synthase catalytic subunit MoaE [Halopseudomonas sp.]|jgi:molybdopterin synthase catalytic subunit|uniref:molybdopterin synthase catalytic subunit MoaE n=1 Tax=Halopseudomonas sp. TaxID=2901191 RepID=UPI0030032BE6|tara:strand:- start:10777 stop:11250 length:474 start_codon:yes stop_codon:yes gene_type:complete